MDAYMTLVSMRQEQYEKPEDKKTENGELEKETSTIHWSCKNGRGEIFQEKGRPTNKPVSLKSGKPRQ